jgi:DNA repair protein RecN (Recombination protein N)
MLLQLQVRNYAIIRETEIILGSNLNIITGETGAGKSILMGALGLILGERADSKVLLNAEEKCVVEGVFDIKKYKLKSFFESEGLDYDEQCIIRREISSAGKSRAFINDTPVSLTQLRDLGIRLVDIVSQNQTLQLNDEQFQLAVVDAFAQSENELQTYKQLYKNWKENDNLLKSLTEKELNARKDEDYLKFVVTELIEARLEPGEQTQLENRLDMLSHADQIQQNALLAFAQLSGNEQSIIDQLNLLRQTVVAASKHHTGMQQLAERIATSVIELKDIAAELETVAEQTEANPEELAKTESRLQLLFGLLKKHHVTAAEELIALRDEFELKLTQLGSLQHEIEAAQKNKQELEAKLEKAADALTVKRKSAVTGIEKEIEKLLKNVQMPDAKLKVEHTLLKSFGSNGMDGIVFLFAANKGSTPQPLQKVASGGELSRLMLCIKSLMNDKTDLPTIVFDEIDTGISGEAALKVSQVMKAHAKRHQVIAITHLPQIAGKADTHFYIYKSSDKATTTTHIRKLNENERVEEIARMLHGENPSEKVIEAARELMG